MADHLPTKAKAHAQEKQILAKVLYHLCVKGKGHGPGNFNQGNDQREKQAGNHGSGNCVFAEKFGMPHHGAAPKDDNGGKAQRGKVFKFEGGNRSVRRGGIGSKVTQNCFHLVSSFLFGSGKATF
ncbi:hypothetical protein SDC9_116581 [bioreactor metagenome]|uniref:Uncharacterized protein n=1 Tax=bioreactor metagenome TaxID=1076179 RepID=A0A645C2R2_9ZZZZ